MKNRICSRITVIIFLVVIFSSLILSRLSQFFGVNLDVSLNGYTDQVSPVTLTAQSFTDGTFQEAFTASLDKELPLYGRMVRTYDTINYGLFHHGKYLIGRHGSAYESPYVEASLALGRFDYADAQKQQELLDMTARMVSVNGKLNAVGKKLYVYVCPGKSTVYPEDVPRNYRDLAAIRPNAVNVTQLLRAQIEQAGTVPYMFCADYADDLEYPAFYTTGLHWSRTYEQRMSQKVIEDLSALTGRHYRNFHMTGAVSSTEPYWRDADVYELLNVWGKPHVTYYQYTTAPDDDEEDTYVPMRILTWGDSFSEGLRYDVTQNLPEDQLISISRDDQVIATDGTAYLLHDNWDNLNWQYCLDHADAVVVEFVEPEITNYTYGFLPYLDQFLDTYEPEKTTGEDGGNGGVPSDVVVPEDEQTTGGAQ